MKRFIYAYLHELRMLMISPAIYWAGVLFIGLLSCIYLFILQDYAQGAHETSPVLAFYGAFWLPTLVWIPMLTMRTLSEERRQGTLQLLLSSSVSECTIVVSKFLAAYSYYVCICWVSLSIPCIAQWSLGEANMHVPLAYSDGLWGGFYFVLASGLFYVAIGVFASAMTRSQLVAGMLSFTLIFGCMLGGRFLKDLSWGQFSERFASDKAAYWLEYFQTFSFLRDFSSGLIDTRPFALYVSASGVVLWMTMWMVRARA